MATLRYANFKIRWKLFSLLVLVGVPFGLMTWSYVHQANKDISFATMERNGLAYVQSLTPLLAELTKTTTGLDAGHLLDLDGERQIYDLAFNSRDEVSSFLTAAGRPDPALALDVARTALIKIADGSNLTLDPELDSYYLMDLVTVRLPELLASSVTLRRALNPFSGTRHAELSEFAILIGAISRFDRAREAAQNSLTTALRGNADGSVLKGLSEKPSAFLASAHRVTGLSSTIASALEAGLPPQDGRQVATALEQHLENAMSLMVSAQVELSRLLTARIDQFKRELQFKLGLQLGFFGLIGLLTMGAARSLARPLAGLSKEVELISKGAYQTTVTGCDRSDEIGDIARAIDGFRLKMIDAARIQEEKELLEQRGKEQRSRLVQEVATRFQAAAGDIIIAVNSASKNLELSANDMSFTAGQTQNNSELASGAAIESSGRVTAMAVAAEELAIAVSDISRQLDESSNIAQQAIGLTHLTDGRMKSLSAAADRIGSVLNVITEIAQQTNLLALNATIEAARAGDAGRGFAVVASEVKLLASQSALATQDIGKLVAEMQRATRDSVSSIQEVSGTIQRMSDITIGMASAFVEQSAITREISSNAQRTAELTQEVAVNIDNVNSGAQRTSEAANLVYSSAERLARQSDGLAVAVTDLMNSLT